MSAQHAGEELEKFYDAYLIAVNRSDWPALIGFFAYPWAWESVPHAVKVLDDPAAFLQVIGKNAATLKERGWARSEVDNISSWTTALDTAFLVAEVTRYRSDGGIVEHKRARYSLRRDHGAWKIVSIIDSPLT